MNTFSTWDSDQAISRIHELSHLPGGLLPILHALQEDFGYVDEAAVPLIAEALNLSKAEVHGVITFYHDFRFSKPGRHLLQVCRAEACQSMGCERLIAGLEQHLGIKTGETTQDESVTLQAVYCLGNCALSPAAMLDGQPHGRFSLDLAQRLLADTRGRP